VIPSVGPHDVGDLLVEDLLGAAELFDALYHANGDG
jgi:hypothetical protein